MRALLATVLLLTCLCATSRAEDAPISAQDQAAIRSVITNQIDAFRRDDAAGAFGYAAPSTQGVFGTADNFLAMVRRGYQPVYRPHAVEFAQLARQEEGVIQNVELVGPDGLPYTARYTLERETDGSWRIISCELLHSTRLGV